MKAKYLDQMLWPLERYEEAVFRSNVITLERYEEAEEASRSQL